MCCTSKYDLLKLMDVLPQNNAQQFVRKLMSVLMTSLVFEMVLMGKIQTNEFAFGEIYLNNNGRVIVVDQVVPAHWRHLAANVLDPGSFILNTKPGMFVPKIALKNRFDELTNIKC